MWLSRVTLVLRPNMQRSASKAAATWSMISASPTGTFVNDRRVQGRNLLKDGFRVKLGNTTLLLHELDVTPAASICTNPSWRFGRSLDRANL